MSLWGFVTVLSSQHLIQRAGNIWKLESPLAHVKFYSLLGGAGWDGASQIGGPRKKTTAPPYRELKGSRAWVLYLEPWISMQRTR